MTTRLRQSASDASAHTVRREFARLLCLALSAKVVVELPVQDGETTVMLARVVQLQGGRLISVGNPHVLASIERRLSDEGLHDVTELVPADSADALLHARPADIDLVLAAPPAMPAEPFLDLLAAVTPRLRRGAVVFSPSRVTWYAAHVRDPVNGFRTSLPVLGAISLWDGTAR